MAFPNSTNYYGTMFGAENPLRRYREQASQGYFNMVSVDEYGKPILVLQLLIETDDEETEWQHVRSLLVFRVQRKTSSTNTGVR